MYIATTATTPRLMSLSLSLNWRKIVEAAAISLLVAAVLGVFGLYSTVQKMRDQVQGMREQEDKQVLPALQEVSKLVPMSEQFPELQKEMQGTRNDLSGLKNNVTSVRSKLNDEVIPWINEVKKIGPPIKPALDSLYKKQQELDAAVAKLQASDEGRAASIKIVQEREEKRSSQLQSEIVLARESNEKQVSQLQDQLEDLNKTLWAIDASALKGKLQQTVRNALKPIIDEWQTIASEQSRAGVPIPAARTFIPIGIAVSTRPHVEVTVEGDVVSLSGVVPSEKAKKLMAESVEAFRPKPSKVDTEKLRVHP